MDNTNFRIVAFDPGGTTGWATFTVARIGVVDSDSRAKYEYYNPKFNCGFFDNRAHHSELYDFMGMQRVTETIYVTESFEFRNKHRDNVELISRNYIGVIELFCQQNGTQLISQTASEGKVVDRKSSGFVKPENLKKLGLWQKPIEIWKHSMDAYGHLLYYMIHQGIYAKELLEKGWSPDV